MIYVVNFIIDFYTIDTCACGAIQVECNDNWSISIQHALAEVIHYLNNDNFNTIGRAFKIVHFSMQLNK